MTKRTEERDGWGADPDGSATVTCTAGIHVLYHSEEFWMADTNADHQEMWQLAEEAHGDVLTGGYGMGILQRYLLVNPRVRTVTSVELCCDVIRVALERDGWLYGRVIIGDMLEVELGRLYDTVIGDLWADASERFIPLYEAWKARLPQLLKPGGTRLAWKGEVFEQGDF